MNLLTFTKTNGLALGLAVLTNILLLATIPFWFNRTTDLSRKEFTAPIQILSCGTYDPHRDVQPESRPCAKTPRSLPALPSISVQADRQKMAKPLLNVHLPSIDCGIPSNIETQTFQASLGQTARGGFWSKEFGFGEVDQVPQVIRRIRPCYPYLARRRNINGKVIVKFLVDSTGQVRKATILKAAPKGIFEQSVLEAVKKWEFRPGYWRGHPVATWVVVPIKFTLGG